MNKIAKYSTPNINNKIEALAKANTKNKIECTGFLLLLITFHPDKIAPKLKIYIKNVMG